MHNTNLSAEQQSYERDELWDPEIFTAENHQQRLGILTQHVPPDVRTILDVGCGGGAWLHGLANGPRRFTRLCGVERSLAALKFVQTEKYQASIDRLPFRDREFDLVASFEVIEHLPVGVFELALRELSRTAAKYLMVSVPNNENLEESLVRCPVCRTRYSPDYHMRSFDRVKLGSLYDDFGFRNTELFEMYPLTYNKWSKQIRRVLGFGRENALRWYAICPVCRHTPDIGPPTPNSSEQVLHNNRLKEMIKKVWPKEVRYEWLAAVYRRERAS
jgi:SAM-dependent methyltransferase